MQYIIDRFEQDHAILENPATLQTIHCVRNDLPADAAEGDALILHKDGSFSLDADETRIRAERIRKRFDRLLGRV